jgi:peptide/nickel transport system permease protein
VRQDTVGDYVTRSFAIIALALPGFWVGTLVMVVPVDLVGAGRPTVKYSPSPAIRCATSAQLAIPALILGKASRPSTMRLTRTMMLGGDAPGLHPHRARQGAWRRAPPSSATRCATR